MGYSDVSTVEVCRGGIRHRARSHLDSGFTLIEVMIGILLLAVVMGAVAPEFYGVMASASSTDQRSTATGLAIAANEQLRSLPYWQLGYNPAGSGAPASTITPSACSGPNPVEFSPSQGSPPVPALPQSDPTHTYTISRCIYWVSASNSDTEAYKQSIVTVSWHDTRLGSQSVAETSALYPGGEGLYSSPANEWAPGSSSGAGSVYPPASPQNPPAATDDPTYPTTLIDVTWSAPTSTPTPIDHYIVEYNTTGTFGDASTFASSPNVTGTTWNTGSFTPSSTYYFRVLSVSADGTQSSPTSAVTASTTSDSTSCSGAVTLSVTPSTGVMNKQGTLVNSSTGFSLAVNVPSACQNVTVAYNTSSSTLYFAAVTGSGGQLNGTAGSSSTVWSPGNHPFTVYVGGTQYSPLAQVQVNICQEQGNSGKC